MEINQFPLKKGEKEFLKHFEKHPHFEELRKKEETPEAAKEHIKEYLKNLTEEISKLPEIEREAEIHKENIAEISSILAQAINLVLEEGFLEGLVFIRKFNNPYLLDAFHDLLAGHFYELLIRHKKLKASQ
ncbi:MAG: hypothetical protein QXO12_02260 [Candidatus Pacearchaeota archaeon]